MRRQLATRDCLILKKKAFKPQRSSQLYDAGLELACKKAGIEGITWHRLRHTFTTRLVEHGADLVTVQQLLGHSTVTVTMRYAHPNLDSKRNAVTKLEGFGDSSVTPCTKMQQSKPKVSPIAPLKAVASYT